MRAWFQKRRWQMVVGGLLVLAMLGWRSTSRGSLVRYTSGGPSDRVIQRGIAAGWTAERHLNTHGAATAPPGCDQSCIDGFAVSIAGMSERQVAERPSFWGDAGRLPYYDVSVSFVAPAVGRQDMTVRFWDIGSGWEIGEPLLGVSVHLVVTEWGVQSYGIE